MRHFARARKHGKDQSDRYRYHFGRAHCASITREAWIHASGAVGPPALGSTISYVCVGVGCETCGIERFSAVPISIKLRWIKEHSPARNGVSYSLIQKVKSRRCQSTL